MLLELRDAAQQFLGLVANFVHRVIARDSS
jgi:hypothetical protein